jgi:hypothetical protein
MRDRIPGAPERMQRVAEVVARLDMRGVERDCFLIFRARFVEAIERRKRNAEIVARLRRIRLDRQRLADQLFGLLRPPLPARDGAEIV